LLKIVNVKGWNAITVFSGVIKQLAHGDERHNGCPSGKNESGDKNVGQLLSHAWHFTRKHATRAHCSHGENLPW
jgi:hypothetical protein